MWEVKPYEDADWGYARNAQILLKTPMAEYSTSAFTAPLKIADDVFYGANRDYCWQGLLIGPVQGSVYKILDAIYLHFPNLNPLPKGVLIDVDRCLYKYECEDGEEVSIDFALRDETNGPSLYVTAGRPCWYALFLDSVAGNMWVSGEYVTKLTGERLVITPSAIPLQIAVEGFDECEQLGLGLEWRYKLGDGFRRDDHGLVKFVEHRRSIYAPSLLHSSKGSLRINVPVPGCVRSEPARPDVGRALSLGDGEVAAAIGHRIKTLSTYTTFLDGVWFPEAGAWWFRRPWIRDALEGIRWNLRTYLEFLGWEDRVLSLMLHLLDALGSGNGLPIMMGTAGQFTSDAPPQLLYIASRMSGNRDLHSKLTDVTTRMCERLFEGLPVSGTVLEGSILCSPANSSWIDSIVYRGDAAWPTRLPSEWRGRVSDPFSSEFGLVEVNALYIEALGEFASACRQRGTEVPAKVEEFLRTLKAGYVRYFKRDGELPPLTAVPSHGLTDTTIGSPAVVAAVVLRGALYDDKELRKFWDTVAGRLLVKRKPIVLGGEMAPFGMLVRDVRRTPYLGDNEYHGPTIWPRDTPYLLRLMEATGEDISGLLLNNLDHMVAEGAIGYCNEMFSLPVGGNPNPSTESGNPVPVKNPAQFWSHWCDPYVDNLARLLR